MFISIIQRFPRCAALFSTVAGILWRAALAEQAFDSPQTIDATRMNEVSPAITTLQPPQPSIIEKSVYWSTWWGYHASFISDFTVTGMIIDRGGREGDPLYTQFGERNTVGVIGSALAFHAVFSLASYAFYRASNKRYGAWRILLYATATGINSYFLAVHTYATIGNIDLYNRLSR